VQRIEAAGQMFDPNLHQAIERFETEEVPDGTIVSVFQDGYMFHGRVLRPAIVRVAVNSEKKRIVLSFRGAFRRGISLSFFCKVKPRRDSSAKGASE
jgi:hypothetical protein